MRGERLAGCGLGREQGEPNLSWKLVRKMKSSEERLRELGLFSLEKAERGPYKCL